MDSNWIPIGFQLYSKWIPIRCLLDSYWIPIGLLVDSWGILLDSHRIPIEFLLDSYRLPIDFLLDSYRIPIGFLLESRIAIGFQDGSYGTVSYTLHSSATNENLRGKKAGQILMHTSAHQATGFKRLPSLTQIFFLERIRSRIACKRSAAGIGGATSCTL